MTSTLRLHPLLPSGHAGAPDRSHVGCILGRSFQRPRVQCEEEEDNDDDDDGGRVKSLTKPSALVCVAKEFALLLYF